MPLTVPAALNLFVFAAMGSVAVALLLATRRRSESVLLGVFLGLVAVNFLAGAFPEDRAWQRIGYAALALDPLYLLLFVTAFPFRRRTPAVRALLVLVGAWAAASLVLTVVDPALQVDNPRSLEHAFIIAELVLAYGAAWVLAVRAAREAPTPLLGQRASWVAMAVGVAVVPRLGLLMGDFPWVLSGQSAAPRSLEGVKIFLVDLAVAAGLTIGVFALGVREARGRPSELGLSFRVVAAVAGGLLALRALIAMAIMITGADSTFRLAVPFGVRWLPFAAILFHGILAYEVVAFDRANDRILPAVGAAWGAALAALTAAVLAGPYGLDEGVTLALAGLAAAAAAPPAWAGTRAIARRVVPPGGDEGQQRRLHLFRAAVEAAWARGPPRAEGREGLERDRRAFGVSFEEARAIEHIVAGAVAPAAPVEPGKEVLPGVMLEGLLGQGAHGRVYAARTVPDGRALVVKELRSDGGGEAARRRFLAELRALQRLRHPRIVRLLDVQVQGGRQLLLMDRVHGPSLAERLARGPLPPVEARGLAGDLLDALEYAHARGVVHRDVKPGNVLLGPDGRAFLTDFGVATVEGAALGLAGTVSNLDALGSLQGTLAYAAPEQLGPTPAGPPADLYALGLVLYEALTGRPALDLRGLPVAAALEAVARPRIDLEAVPPAWRHVLGQALHPDPARRFPSATAMRRALPTMTG